MNKKKALIIALIFFILFIIFGVGAYFMFHYLTTAGTFSSEFHKQAQKPLVTNIAAEASLMFFVTGLIFLLIGLIGFSKNKRLN